MTDHQFSVGFEIYLLAGTTFLISTFVDNRLEERISRFTRRLRPKWNKTKSLVLRIILLIVFVPLTILNTFSLLGLLPQSSQ
jgi:hypothetical protein